MESNGIVLQVTNMFAKWLCALLSTDQPVRAGGGGLRVRSRVQTRESLRRSRLAYLLAVSQSPSTISAQITRSLGDDSSLSPQHPFRESREAREPTSSDGAC